MSPPPVSRDVILGHLARVLSSSAFGGAERSIAILRFLVERTIDGDGDRLKEYTVGVEALGRGASFDPRTDPIVRAEASRLRARLERYYADQGRDDELVIELPKGTYVPRFATRGPRQVVSEPAASQSPDNPWRTRARASVWLVVGSAAVLSAFTIGSRVAKPSAPAAGPALMRLDVQLQSSGSIGSEVGTDVVLAPDGSGVVFVSTDSSGVSRVRLRRFDRSSSVDLPGTEGARGPFWSPDARWVGFWAHGQLKKTPIEGGSPVVVCDAPDLLGASWSEDKSIVAAIDASSRLVRVSAAGGVPSTIVDLRTTGVRPQWPQLLPGGKAVLYTAIAGIGADRGSIEVASLSSGRRTVVVKGGTFGRFVAPHYLTYVNQGTLYAVRFDPRRLETRGTPVPIIDDVAYSPTFGFAQVTFSDSGLLVYRRAPSNGQSIVTRIDSAGHVKQLVTTPGRYTWPTLSPDGRRLAVSVVESGATSISIFDDLNSVASTNGLGRARWSRDCLAGRRPLPDHRYHRGVDLGSRRWRHAHTAAHHRTRCGAVERVARWTPACIRLGESGDRVRSLDHAGGGHRRCRPHCRAGGFPSVTILRDLPDVLARWPLARLRIERERIVGGLRARLSPWRRARSSLSGRRTRAAVVRDRT
jgi:serine/threonine-protein kinase